LSEPKSDDGFDHLMESLEVMFHMLSCPNHTPDDRLKAVQVSFDAYNNFIEDGVAKVMGHIAEQGPPPGTRLH